MQGSTRTTGGGIGSRADKAPGTGAGGTDVVAHFSDRGEGGDGGFDAGESGIGVGIASLGIGTGRAGVHRDGAASASGSASGPRPARSRTADGRGRHGNGSADGHGTTGAAAPVVASSLTLLSLLSGAVLLYKSWRTAWGDDAAAEDG
jgi:hypothetical protein